jgi:hypothetical protein
MIMKSDGFQENKETGDVTLKMSGVLFKSLMSFMAAASKKVNWRHCETGNVIRVA